MRQNTALEFPPEETGEKLFGQRSPFLSGLNYQFESLRVAAENAAASEAVVSETEGCAAPLFGPPRWNGKSQRSEARARQSAPLWVTSLQRPGVFETVPTENVSKFGLQMVTQNFWEPAELVLVSSPPGFFVQGSVVYCKKLPSDNHILGIRLDGPVEHWIEKLGRGGFMGDAGRSAA